MPEAKAEVTLNLTAEEALRLEEVITDRDAQEALKFVLEVLKPKLQAKEKRTIDQKKGMGMV